MMIYDNEFLVVKQSTKYPNVPGFYEILLKENEINNNVVTELAYIEKKLRDCLKKLGVELVGIYKETDEMNSFKIYIISYHVKYLKELNISPDLYQPYIENYLNSFNLSHLKEVQYFNKNIKMFLENGDYNA